MQIIGSIGPSLLKYGHRIQVSMLDTPRPRVHNGAAAESGCAYALERTTVPLRHRVASTPPVTDAASYAARFSGDMAEWDADLDDSISVDRDENPEDAEHITVTFTLEEPLKNQPRLFFRIEEAP